jgi:hypothetical protein
MKNRILLVLLIPLLLACAGPVFTLTEGSLTPLKGEKNFNLQFSYEGLHVGKLTEKEFLSVQEDKFKERWFSSRKSLYQPIVETNCNIYLEKKGMLVKEGATDAKYTLIIRTLNTEPGYSNARVYLNNPNSNARSSQTYITCSVDIVETANPEKVISRLTSYSVDGVDNYEDVQRIAGAYEYFGKYLGKYLLKVTQ